jgi:hypothetical protein
MSCDYYTYAYLREDRTPYYIGKGRGNRAYSIAGRKMHRRPEDRSRILILKRNLTEEEAFKHECYMIAVLGRKDNGSGILRNLTDGGEGSKKRRFIPCGEAQKEANRKSMLARYAAGLRMDGEHNPRAKTWKITYTDGREVIVKGLQKWVNENGYNRGGINKLKTNQWKRYRDLVSIEEVRETEPSTP